MDIRQKQAIEAYQRVQDFVYGHPLASPGGYGTAAKRLDEAIARLSNHTSLQVHGGRQAQVETRRQKALKRHLREQHLRPIAKIAKAVLREVPGIDAALRIPDRRLPVTQLIATAMAIAEAVAPYEATFVEIGRPADFLKQLDGVIADLRGSLVGRARSIGKRAGAGLGIKAAIKRGRDAVEMIDTIVTTAFADRPDVLGEWRSARRVQASPGASGVPAVAEDDAPLAA